ncbi:MAG: putative bifunctional diguanylate cyclase/phosphodiesterase [Actinomycetota bacterium]
MSLGKPGGQHDGILPVLYDLALVIGGEVSLKPLLTRCLQRLLYYTSFPAGFVCLDLPSPGDDLSVEARIEVAVGDYNLVELAGTPVRLPVELLRPSPATSGDAGSLLSQLPVPPGRYNSYLRLPIDGRSVIVLLAPQLPETELPVTRMFMPAMAQLAKAIVLCRSYDSQQKANEAQIAYLVTHDSLTGLPNRVLLQDRVEHAIAAAIREKKRVALLYVDIDDFKTINDNLGHAKGDELLKVVAERLRACIRDMDTVSRQGSDEFLVLLSELEDGSGAALAAAKILGSLAHPIQVNGTSLDVSATIGISLGPDDGRDFDTLLKTADTALRFGKEYERGSYRFFTDAMNQGVRDRFFLESRLHGALDRREFILHYQPQVELGSGRIVGAEALIRWNSPDLGLIPPVRFIPLAEQTGAIVAIGAWVIEEACRQAMAWRAAGLPMEVIAVNLSAVQFTRGRLLETVTRALADSGLPPECLELEITESILIHDTEQTLAAVRSLKALGLRLSLDDFGTGYSSLAYLTRFAVDKLKVDQSFVRDLDTSKEAAKIVRTIIELGRGLGLETIAEGIETVRQSEILCAYGCNQGQGYYYSRPVPAEEFARLLEADARARARS